MTAVLRLAVFLLILANLLFFAWAQGYFGQPLHPDSLRLEQQLFPEQIRVVARAPAAAKTDDGRAAGGRNGETDVCRQWNEVANADADQIERVLAQEFAAFRASRKTSAEVNGYWVFVPPLANRDEANRKAAELEQLGVQELLVVTGGPNQMAISLGTYRTEAAANTRLEALRALGVKSARVGERKGKPVNTLEIRGPEAQFEALRQTLAGLLPKLADPVICAAGSENKP